MDVLFGRYEVKRELGRGSFGTVYHVRDTLSDAECALKLFTPRWVRRHLIERFRREFAVVARMPHRRIVKVFDFGEEGGKYFYTMELVEGPTLEGTRLDASEALEVLCDIAEGLAHIHSRGILHLDLKPSNVFVTSSGAKIGDFGLARALTEDEGPASGTVAYLAPEVLRGYPPDVRTDLYALGVIAAEIFTGANPFEGSTASETIQLQMHYTPDESDLAAVPKELRGLVLSLLDKDPRRRPNSAYSVWRKLAQILGREDDPSLRARFLPQPALVGRDEILSMAERLISGLSRKVLWVLRGAPGSGYSRILAEIKIVSQLGGCHPVVISPAAPLESLLRQLLVWEFGGPLRRHLPRLLVAAPGIAGHPTLAAIGVTPSPSEPTADEVAMHALALVEEISELKPLVIMFEDGVPEDFVKRFLSRPQRGRILFVARELRDEFEVYSQESELTPLSREEITQWIFSVFGDVDGVEKLVLRLSAETGGLPRNIQTKLKEFVVSGALVPQIERWRYSPQKASPVQLAVPKKLLDDTLARIALSPLGLPASVVERVAGEENAPLVLSELMAMGKVGEGERYGLLVYFVVDDGVGRGLSELPAERLRAMRREVGSLLCEVEDAPAFQLVGAEMLMSIGEVEQAVRVARKTVKVFRQRYEFSKMLKAIDLLIEGAQALGDKELWFKAVKRKCGIYSHLGRLDEAQALYQELLSFVRQKVDLENEAAVLNDLGVVLFEQKKPQKAIQYYNEALELARQVKNPKLELYAMINIAASLQEMGDFQEAAARFWQARSIAQRLQNHLALATIEADIGMLLASQARYRQALDRLLEGASIAHEHGYFKPHAAALIEISIVHRRMGNLELAEGAISEFERLFGDEIPPFERVCAETQKLLLALYRGDEIAPAERFAAILPDLASLPEGQYEAALLDFLPWAILVGLPFSELQKLPVVPQKLPTSHLWEALALFESGQFDAAFEAAERALDATLSKHKDAELWCAACRILASSLQPAEAGEKLLELLSDPADDLFVQGDLWQRVAEIYAERVPDPERGNFALNRAKEFFSRLGNRSRLAELERIADLLRGSRYGGDAGLLLEVAKAFTSTLDTDALVRVILDRAIEVSGAGRALLLAFEDGEPTVVSARSDEGVDLTPDEVRFSRGAVQKAIAQRKPLLVESVPEDEELAARQSIVDLRILMVIAVPLFWRGELLGVLYADAEMRRAAFSERTVRLLEALGEFAALALHNARLFGEVVAERDALRAQARERIGANVIIGEAPAMQEVYRRLSAVAPQDVTVLLTGETGTGKDLVARVIHSESRRRDGPFVAINCAAVPETLLEAELFGYEKGAFTGATRRTKGKLELAHGGTLFLDEIGDMAPPLQAKLLNAIETGKFMRLGGTEEVQVDVRIIAATNKDLEEEIRRGNFREDLYYRISTVRIHLPPLRHRRQDIPALAHHFLREAAQRFGKEVGGFAPEVMAALRRASWPGNVRQLKNAVEEMVLFATGEIITPDLLPDYVLTDLGESALPGAFDLSEPQTYEELKASKKALAEQFEREVIKRLLQRYDFNVSRAAKAFGIHRTRLHQLIAKYGLRKGEER